MKRFLHRPILAAILLGIGGAAMSEGRDLAGWDRARWGMTGAEIARAYGDRLTRLPGRWSFGAAYAELALRDVTLGKHRFTAFFQMEEASERLQQVLLERRAEQVTPIVWEDTFATLRALHGEPARSRLQSKAQGGPLVVEAIWVFPTTTVHAVYIDFRTTAVFTDDPNTERDPRQPSLERRRNNPRFMPLRILVRYHPTARTDLLGSEPEPPR